MTGFLYGWSLFTVIQTGTIAAVAVAFGKFTAYLIPELNNAAPVLQYGEIKITWIQIIAISIILLLTFINTKGVQSGKIVQSIFTSSKILALVVLIVGGIFMIRQNFLLKIWHRVFRHFRILKERGGERFQGAWLWVEWQQPWWVRYSVVWPGKM